MRSISNTFQHYNPDNCCRYSNEMSITQHSYQLFTTLLQFMFSRAGFFVAGNVKYILFLASLHSGETIAVNLELHSCIIDIMII